MVSPTTRVFLSLVALSALGCDAKAAFLEDAPSAVRVRDQAGERPAVNDFANVPVPSENGPRLAPLALAVPIRKTPEPTAPAVGYLRVGAKVARSGKPVSHVGCEGGFYAVRPLGFVCAGADATLKLDHPIARAFMVEPDRGKPMPYKYAFVRAIAPNYLRVPTTEEQFRYEMRLERHLRNHEKLAHKWDELDVGANDIPLDERGLAVGKIPPHAVPMDLNARFGGNGDDAVPWWLQGERRLPNISSFRAPPYAVIAGRIKRHAGVALIGTFVAGPEAQKRRFAVSTDLRLLPADKLKADSGSPFHGSDIAEVGLPVAFVRKEGAHYYELGRGDASKGEVVDGRELVPLTGTVREVGGKRFVQTRDGRFLRSADIKTVPKSSSVPFFAKGTTKWIEISILNQTMVLWEGSRPVYATLVSTGRDGLGDPKTTHSTPLGTFRILQKHVTTTMDSNVADQEFELRDVPWVMYFHNGYALHAAYWHDDFGRQRSHGCVNLSPIDARYAFFWSSPDVPKHWHGAYAGDAFGQGTLVHIRP